MPDPAFPELHGDQEPATRRESSLALSLLDELAEVGIGSVEPNLVEAVWLVGGAASDGHPAGGWVDVGRQRAFAGAGRSEQDSPRAVRVDIGAL